MILIMHGANIKMQIVPSDGSCGAGVERKRVI
jgi:hypothetical protein